MIGKAIKMVPTKKYIERYESGRKSAGRSPTKTASKRVSKK